MEPVPMNSDGARASGWEGGLRSWLPAILLLGVYLTVRGYHCYDGDQAYRLPLLLHRQDPGLYANDSFVRALDGFNPHRGSLALLDAVSRPFGLPAGLFLIFCMTFLATCWGVRRMAGRAWLDLGPAVGWVAIGLILSAKAGNIGTNHLFEAMVLDRLVAMAIGWVAIAQTVTDPSTRCWRSPGLDRAGDDHSSLRRAPARDGPGSELVVLGAVRSRDVRRSSLRAQKPGLARGRRHTRTGHQFAATLDTSWRGAPGSVLVAERRDPEPAAHAAAPLAHAAMARLVQLFRPRVVPDRPVEPGKSRACPNRSGRRRSRDGFDGRSSSIVDHARHHPGRAGNRLVRNRDRAHGPGDDLPAVPCGNHRPGTGLDPDRGPSRGSLAGRIPARPDARARSWRPDSWATGCSWWRLRPNWRPRRSR